MNLIRLPYIEPELEEKIELITKKGDLVDWSFMAYNFIKDKKNVYFVKYEDLVKT